MGSRSSGGVFRLEMSRTPVRAMYKVRGIGVAVRVRTSTSVRSLFRCSLWETPKRCSSSMTTRPSSLNCTSAESRRWVPITISTSPRANRLKDLCLLPWRTKP